MLKQIKKYEIWEFYQDTILNRRFDDALIIVEILMKRVTNQGNGRLRNNARVREWERERERKRERVREREREREREGEREGERKRKRKKWKIGTILSDEVRQYPTYKCSTYDTKYQLHKMRSKAQHHKMAYNERYEPNRSTKN